MEIKLTLDDLKVIDNLIGDIPYRYAVRLANFLSRKVREEQEKENTKKSEYELSKQSTPGGSNPIRSGGDTERIKLGNANQSISKLSGD